MLASDGMSHHASSRSLLSDAVASAGGAPEG